MQSITARLLNMEKGLVFLSAPSSGGKTRLVKRIKELKSDTLVVSSEQFTQAVLGAINNEERPNLLDAMAESSCICIEDLDFYGGRQYTGYEFAEVLSRFAKESLVIVTGIDLKARLKDMFSRLSDFDYYEKKAVTDEWI